MPVEPRHASDIGQGVQTEIAIQIVVDVGQDAQEPSLELALVVFGGHHRSGVWYRAQWP